MFTTTHLNFTNLKLYCQNINIPGTKTRRKENCKFVTLQNLFISILNKFLHGNDAKIAKYKTTRPKISTARYKYILDQ